MLYVLMSRLGQQGKTTIARHVLAANIGQGADVLTVESSTPDGAEGLLLQAAKEQDHVDALALLLASLSEDKKSQVVDIGNTDLDPSLPSLIAHAKAGHKVHAILPLTDDQKSPRHTAELAQALQGVPNLLVTVVFNNAASQEAPAALSTVIEAFRQFGAELLPVGLVGNPALTLKTSEELRAAAGADPERIKAETNKARKASDMTAVLELAAQFARIGKAKAALANTRAVFEAIQAREKGVA